MLTLLADAPVPSANTMWLAIIAGGSVLSNLATVGIFLASLRKAQSEVTFGFVPASKDDFEKERTENGKSHLEIFHEINRLKSENLAMTREIGTITNQTLATLANAQKILNQS